MSLPLSWVDEILSRLAVRYGSRWSSLWQGVDIELVKEDWSNQLDGMKPENIKRALASLPDDFPPTATAFRKLGHIREEAQTVALPAPDSAGLKRIAEVVAPAIGYGMETPREFMNRLQREVQAGTASPTRRRFYADVLATGYYGNVQDASAAGGHFTPPPADTLPPGMRA